MDIDQLRNSIWDHLYQARSAKTIEEIATHAARDVTAVSAAINHEWFTVIQDRVSIAYSAPSWRES